MKSATRCRVTYGRDVSRWNFSLYQIRPVHSLQLVRGGQIETGGSGQTVRS